ncbi:hypothetical protein [Rhabdaerophilum calidifontis]|uniref:hypothetical protein n=1 Tax=Rhabdaerophilum calidifontis TaxID=2604328 RepID=UPI00123A7C63|nr:hypothetical protein [Rhabdaerophilum calidifontis]
MLLATPASAQEAPDCKGLVARFEALIDLYYAEGVKAVETEDPGPAMDRARKAAIAGQAEATIRMVGIGIVLRGRPAAFTIDMVRQVCTYADRNGHPLHIVSCAYFNALNPLGDKTGKRRLVEIEIERYALRRGAVPMGASGAPERFDADIALLKACLPRA